jgi:hypothetical protein
MAKNSNNLSGLLRNSNKINGQSVSKLLGATNLVAGSSGGSSSGSSSRLPSTAQSGLKATSLTAKSGQLGISFGNAPSSALKSDSSGSQWTDLLKQATSGNGLASVFTGGFGGLGGIGSLVSGIVNLFGGGKKNPPALTPFHLPDSQQRTASIGAPSSGSGVTAAVGSSAHATGVYGTPGQTQAPPSNTDSQWFVDNSNNIAQAVKTAMLNSNSLNDVVSEV